MAGSIVYFDGLHNDSRTCLALALTASAHGATVANYVEMVEFIKAKQSKEIIGVRMRDNLTGHEWNTFGKVVINATGCGVDRVRRKDNCQLNENENLIVPSRGTHLMLPSTFSSENYGMLIPQTKDGRVAFLLPFEGVTIAGTTDVAMQAQELPDTKQLVQPSQSEVAQILTEINNYLDVHVKATDVDAAWSGVRPLGCVPDGYRQTVINDTVNVIKRVETEATLQKQQKVDASTKSLSRHHLIEVSATGLITICGGKWTTYRQMAQDCVDIACDLHPEIGARASECVTKVVKIVGAAKWSHGVPAVLERHNIPPHIAKHLSNAYGDKAFMVGDLYLSKWDQLLAGGYSYTEAEVIYCSKYEMSQTPIDMLSRRTRLAQLNKAAAEYALPKVIQLMASVHGWSSRDCVMHYHNTMEFLRTMHVEDSRRWGRSRHTLGDARRVVETTLDGISMTDEAMQFVMDRFQHYYSSTGNELEMCIARAHCLELAKEFSAKFGDDRSCVIDALMFTQQKQLGLYEILVSCAACAGHRELFE
eukprot:398657_1